MDASDTSIAHESGHLFFPASGLDSELNEIGARPMLTKSPLWFRTAGLLFIDKVLRLFRKIFEFRLN